MRRLLVPLVPLAVLVALASGGCDTTEPQDYVPHYDPNDQSPLAQLEFCPLLARESCAVVRPCCQNSPYAFDENKCRVTARALCESRKTRSLAAGLRYDDFMAGRCVHGTAALVRECNLVSVDDDPDANAVKYACGMVWHGDKVPPSACDVKKLECAPIADRRVSCVGQCIASKLATGGEECGTSGTLCAAGLVCRKFGTVSRCTAHYHALGTACRGDFECEPGDIFCDLTASPTTTSGICRTLPHDGEPCASIEGRSASDRRCARGSKCDTDVSSAGVCTLGKPLGAICTDNVDCASGACLSLQQICIPSTLADPFVCDGAMPGAYGGLTSVLAPPTE